MIAESKDQIVSDDSTSATRTKCLNCGSQVLGNYCHSCGQHTREHNQGVWQFVLEFLEEFIRFDSKFLRTIVPLIIKPGFLTREWVAGKRVRYISPLKLYISLSAICFLMVSLTTHPNVVNVGNGEAQSIAEARTAIDRDKESTNSEFKKWILDQTGKFTQDGSTGAARRQEFNDKFVGRLSTANLILLPIFALLFKFLYIRRSKFYVEHLVFALHYYAFFCLSTACILLFTKVVHFSPPAALIVIWMLVYLPVSMMVNYQQGFIKSVIKCWIFCSLYVIAISIVLLGMVVWTAVELPSASPPLKSDLKKAGSSKPTAPKKPTEPGMGSDSKKDLPGTKPSLPSSVGKSNDPAKANASSTK